MPSPRFQFHVGWQAGSDMYALELPSNVNKVALLPPLFAAFQFVMFPLPLTMAAGKP